MSQFYLEAWLLMHYILVGDQSLRSGLNTFLGGTVNGGDPEALAVKAFGRSLVALDAELKAYYRKQNFQILRMPAPARIEKVSEIATPVAEQDALRALAFAALRSQPEDPGRIAPLFTKLLEIDPGDTSAMAGLALTVAHEKREDADRWMAAVEASKRADPLALRLCGDFYRDLAAHDDSATSISMSQLVSRARQCYQLALAADPREDDALFGLGLVSLGMTADENRGASRVPGSSPHPLPAE